MNPAANIDVRVVKVRQLLEAEVDGEIVALDVDNGQCYGLNAVATKIWALLDETSSLREVCARLEGEFDVEPSECAQQVRALVDELQADGLVAVEQS